MSMYMYVFQHLYYDRDTVSITYLNIICCQLYQLSLL